MSSIRYRNSAEKAPLIIFAIIVFTALGIGAWFSRSHFETEPPQISLTPDTGFLGKAAFELQATDKGSGIKALTATISQGNSNFPLASEQMTKPAIEKNIQLSLVSIAGLKEGPAVLRISARDASFWHFLKGNEAILEKNITIDFTPPALELVAEDRYVNFGGVGVIVYKAADETTTSGVKMGDYFFPGFSGQVKDHPDFYIALFAHPYNSPSDARPLLVASDKAGNTQELKIAYELKNVNYKKSTIALSDAFLQNKVQPLIEDATARQGTPKEQFIAANSVLRNVNETKITEVTKQLTPAIMWNGAFAQLSNSKVEANFADYRTYTYNGEAADSAYHLGYDLSVTRNYPVEASNSGKVAFAGPLGIYGEAVIIDHGLGLFTLYGHLSSIEVKVGDVLNKRQVIGKTGETGLAAGDHLHFGIYLDGLAVLPVEWWDQKWIDDNFTPKLTGKSGQEIAGKQQASKKTKTAKKVRRTKRARHK
jgi:murein DD-endopeptidase MepM/ murein hydrolase activator NlpD